MYINIKCIGKLPGPTNEFERSLVFETGEFERPKFDCILVIFSCSFYFNNWPQHEKTCLRGFANNKGADQPEHLRSLNSAFVIHFLDSIISKLAPSKISIFQLASAAEETGLSLTFSETLKTGFLPMRPISLQMIKKKGWL